MFPTVQRPERRPSTVNRYRSFSVLSWRRRQNLEPESIRVSAAETFGARFWRMELGSRAPGRHPKPAVHGNLIRLQEPDVPNDQR